MLAGGADISRTNVVGTIEEHRAGGDNIMNEAYGALNDEQFVFDPRDIAVLRRRTQSPGT